MIGRADIEGSKSNVAMNAWLPQASYPCGSIGHAFTVRIRTENQNQTSFYPFVPHEISVLVELILGHLRYLLTDVPPQPNSPPDNVLRPDQLPKQAFGPKTGDDEAFGYLKRVIVTPAVYPRLVEFLHFDIQSTGQKSHCVSIRRDHRNALF
ncbi:senescence-associated protein [Micromonas pusilla CCMP1545]|uniref:Senescence-associated protein n=1 Tax=Micromonas pusilla (strain CCMP1545) TaxID=564608 RepID=C1NAM9_MICPC|nr:senescence-associated protein [Micromonas pusilla CCMP1545]|eukprot:XP_003064992.1 senescence-associated protein [Micromonas pusilla CCMP1545]